MEVLEFWEDFLEEAVPEDRERIGFRAGMTTTGGTVLWWGARHGGLDPSAE